MVSHVACESSGRARLHLGPSSSPAGTQGKERLLTTVGDSDTTAHPTHKHTTLAHKYACTIIQVGRGLGKWAATHANIRVGAAGTSPPTQPPFINTLCTPGAAAVDATFNTTLLLL